MNIVTALILSIVIKGISALIEILIQIFITNSAGVNGYGDYVFYVSLIEGAYFLLFSGSVKLNTFYLSNPKANISKYKKKYLCYYVIPIISVLLLVCIFMGNIFGIIATIILLIYYLAFDKSSVFFARGKQLQALLGEYLIGRIAMLICVITALKLQAASGIILLCLYGAQFAIMYVWFVIHRKKIKDGVKTTKVENKKSINYQVSDIATSVVTYSPTVLQYVIGGAFSAGFMGIISIIKKIINFIAGPTAKVFLPEFSKLYRNNDKKGLQKSYLMIVRVQMLFIATAATILVLFPTIVLNIFSKDLVSYATLFSLVSLSLLIIAGMGPVTGLLQMTGGEKICNINQWISIAAMVITWIIFRNEPLFAIYGLCVQAIIEGLLKYISVCKWFKAQVVPINNYLLLWLPVIIEAPIIVITNMGNSYLELIICALINFIWNYYFVIKDPIVQNTIKNFEERKKK